MRISEWVIGAFFTWTAILAAFLPISPAMQARSLFASAGVLLIYLILLQWRRRIWADYLRDWVPQALMILAYWQMGWFAPSAHSYRFEHEWIVWDRLLLDDFHLRTAIEVLGPVLPSLLEISYSLVYAVPPFTMVLLYAAGKRERADTLLTIYLLGLFLCYGQFPFWPSEPPRTVFPGQDMPNVHSIFRDFNLWLVGNHGIHTSVFPSAHVSGVFAAFMAVAYLFPSRRGLKLAYFIYAAMVATATVYGRYHYAVDAVGGFFIGILSAPFGLWLVTRRQRRRAASETYTSVSTSVLNNCSIVTSGASHNPL